MRLQLGLSLAALALPLVFGSQHAAATPASTSYTFSSSGAFSNCSGCTALSGTEIEWGGTFDRHNNYNGDGSTMTAVPLSNQTGTTPAKQDLIGELTWYNASTDSNATSTNVSADYKLTLTFSKPTPGGSSTDSFALNIVNTANNAQVCVWWSCSNTGNVNDTTHISGGSPTIIVDGLVLSNFTFVADDSSFNSSTGIWSNPEGNRGTLEIYADIANAPAAVPEPASMTVLGVGLLGVALKKRRSRA